MIEIRRIGGEDPLAFEVTIRDATGASAHAVTLSHPDYERLTAGRQTPEQFINAAFRFLLDREPKEAILHRFSISVIETYFPEFEQAFVLCAFALRPEVGVVAILLAAPRIDTGCLKMAVGVGAEPGVLVRRR